MQVTLLGTGAADGWPNPWCTCASCTDARNRREQRRPTSALVDGALYVRGGKSGYTKLSEQARAAILNGETRL